MQPNSSQQAKQGGSRITGSDGKIVEIVVEAPEGRPTLHVAYFFSGASRKSSVGEELRTLAKAKNVGLVVHEVDILNGGAAHDLIDNDAQARWEARIRDGEFDITILTPPCSSWTRALFRPGGLPSCRDKKNPWGLSHALDKVRAKARAGNVFVHFTIRFAAAAFAARKFSGTTVRVLIEHPEDLGRSTHGTPASIWQLPAVREIQTRDPNFVSVAGHQCQFEVDYSKPTRLLSDVPGIADFGKVGWPVVDANDWYLGPLPRCGQHHKDPVVGAKADGSGFNSSAKANYPPNMCRFVAVRIFDDWFGRAFTPFRWGKAGTASSRVLPATTSSSSSALPAAVRASVTFDQAPTTN